MDHPEQNPKPQLLSHSGKDAFSDALFFQRATIFKKMVYAVWLILTVYCGIYFSIKAPIPFWSILFGTLVLTPLTLSLENRHHPLSARMLLILSCNFYIYTSSLGQKHLIHAEYYYLSAMMIPLLVFGPKETKYTIFGILTPLLFWALTLGAGYDFVPQHWFPPKIYVEVISATNFLGAFVISLTFLYIFINGVNSLQAFLAQKAHSLNEAQALAKVGSWQFDLKTQKISWSRQMYHLFPEEESRGEPSYERHRSTIHPEDLAHWEETVSECVKGGLPYVMRFRTYRSETQKNEVVWIEARGEGYRDSHGKILGIFGTCQDITEAVKAQNLISIERSKATQNAKLATLGEMAAGVAHEINNPLAIIDGAARLLSKEGLSPLKIIEKSELIKNSVHRIAKIVTGLRRFSRTSNPLEKKWIPLISIFEQTNILTHNKLARFRVSIEVDEESLRPYSVLCDEIGIEQVFVNLIHNAADAIQDLPERWIRIRAQVDPHNAEQVILRFADSGDGIPQKIRDQIFNPFFTTKKVGEGTGLGLSISKGIIEEHHGSITVLESEPHTTFEIKLPGKARSAQEAA